MKKLIKKFWMSITCVFFILVVMSFNVFALEKENANGKTGNLTWNLDDAGVLTISGEGQMPNYSFGTSPWNDYKDKILKVVIEDV